MLDELVLPASLKADLRKSVQHLKDYASRKSNTLQFRPRRGILLLGSPGVGKTSVARALAHEAGCSIIAVAATELLEMYVGVGPQRVRRFFQEARECEGPCIIFIDELDALGTRQGNSLIGDAGMERNSTINQLLVELDGFADEADDGKVLLIAASNRAEMIDPALLRSGRFDIKIKISMPDTQKRAEILFTKLCKIDPTLKLTESARRDPSLPNFSPRGVDSDFSESGSDIRECPRRRAILVAVEELAFRTGGFSPADLSNIVNETVYSSLAAGRDKFISQDLMEAYAKVRQGVEAIKEQPVEILRISPPKRPAGS